MATDTPEKPAEEVEEVVGTKFIHSDDMNLLKSLALEVQDETLN